MNCKYIFKHGTNISGKLSFTNLIKTIENYIEETDGIEFNNLNDYVYSLGGIKSELTSKLVNDKIEANISISKDNRDPSFEFDDKYITPQQLVNSSAWAVNGVKANVRLSDSDYLKNKIQGYIKDGLSEAEAAARANDEKLHWEIINKDGFLIHQLINTFDWAKNEKDKNAWYLHLKGTKFESQAPIIWDQMKSKVSFQLFDTFKLSSDKVSLVRNVTLKAKIPGMEKELAAHYDNIVIDDNGNLHIFNYKYTASPLHEWGSNKIETYKHEMAVLKQVLAANGYDTNKCTLHIIPILVKYNNDFTGITDVEIHTKSETTGLNFELTMKNGRYVFDSYDRVAREVIPSAVVKSKENPEGFINIQRHLSCMMDKDMLLGVDGVRFSVDEWISVNYNSKTQDRIKKIDGGYKVFLNDDYSNPVIVNDPTDPKDNEELRELISENISELQSNNQVVVSRLYDACSQAFLKKRSFIESQSLGNIQGQLNNLLGKYLVVREVGKEKVQDWQLIENDTLKSAGILCLLNLHTNQVDIICLSTRDLRTVIKRKGQTNIMSHFVKDIDAGELINVKNTEENIQALRAVVAINEVLDQLPNKNSLRFGEIKIFSRVGGGQVSVQPFKKFANVILPKVCKIVKLVNKEFKLVNNFKEDSCLDPVTVLYGEYKFLIGNNGLSKQVLQQLQALNIEHLESETSKEIKRKNLIDIAEKLEGIIREKYISHPTPEQIINCANGNGFPQAKALCALYLRVQEALLSLSNYFVDNEYKLNWIEENMPTQNAVGNRTYRGAVNIFIRAVDDIADATSNSLTSSVQGSRPFTTVIRDFYDDSGIGKLNTNVFGDQVKSFQNLYRRNENNEIIMQFKNPFSNDFEDRLESHERKFLKEVLYRINRIRCLRHGIEFNFKGPDDPDFAKFIEEKPNALNVPLKKARKATERVQGTFTDRLKKKLKRSKDAIVNRVKSPTVQSIKETQEDIYSWSLSGEFSESDGFAKGTQENRNRIINKFSADYWETDLESLVIDFEEDYYRARELNKALIEIKAILLHLEILGNQVGKKDGLEQTIDMIHKFIKANFFEKSLLEPEMLKFIEDWVQPFRHLVSRAYIAGNIVSMFRDTIEGVLLSYTRAVNKFNCDISAGNITEAYKEVILNMFHDTTSLDKLDQLCRLYRLSNSDISRISEQMKTGRGGIANYENWMYATLRKPDFLNRMVLFVGRCMQDGTWDAFSVDKKTGKISYDWKKDKRFKAYAENSSNKEEYEKARNAYYNAIMDYNESHNTHITPKDGLPTAYTPKQIESIRELSNNIFGSYDKALRSGLERTAGGIFFASFTTWMNGMWNNYTRIPGIYDEYSDKVEQETDVNGNNVFAYNDKDTGDLVRVIEIQKEDGTKQYIKEDSGEEYAGDINELEARMINVPDVIQGIWNTLKDAKNVIMEAKSAKEAFGNFKSEIWANPKQKKNLEKLLSDILITLLLGLLFKLAISPAYKDYTKHRKENNAAEAGLVYLLYNSSSRSYDGFLGPANVLTHIGNNSNPPFYQLPTKIVGDLGNALFGSKTWDSVITGNVGIFRPLGEVAKTMRAQN